MKDRPLISAIVVNWNCALDLDQELPSLTSQTYEPLEILIMDNGSTDDSAEVVGRFPRVRFVPIGRNLGLAGALNEGVRISAGELVLLLNNDMRFADDFVEVLAAPLVEDQTVFASDALQYNWEATHIVHAATFLGRRHSPAVISLDRLMPGMYLRQERANALTPAVMASAANLMARKSFFLKLGGLDARYTMGYEDMDICWRAWMQGWKTIFVPEAVCWHKVGRASQLSLESALYRFRGNISGGLLFSTKLLPMRYVLSMMMQVTLGAVRDAALLRRSRLADRARVLAQHFKILPHLCRERRVLFANSLKTPSAVWNQLARLGA